MFFRRRALLLHLDVSVSRCSSLHHIIFILLADRIQRTSEEGLVLHRTVVVVEEPQVSCRQRQQPMHRWNGSRAAVLVVVHDVVPTHLSAAVIARRISMASSYVLIRVRRPRTPELRISTIIIVVVTRRRHELIHIHFHGGLESTYSSEDEHC